MIKYRADLHKLLPSDSVIAEIGCAEGYFSSDILRWPNCKTLYMVDYWGTIPTQFGDGASPKDWHDKNYSDAMMRVKFAIERVKVLRGISWDMASRVENESIDMVYLDACHSYDCVKKDLEAWYPKLKVGGFMAGHDYLNRAYGVFDAVRDFVNGRFEIVTIHENKTEDAGFYFIKK